MLWRFQRSGAATSPVRGTLIGALDRRGVSVEDLARHKEVDLLDISNCWISGPIENSELNFRHLLCIEPAVNKQAPAAVGDVFRSLIPYVTGEPWISRIALPLLSSGNQGFDPVAYVARDSRRVDPLAVHRPASGRDEDRHLRAGARRADRQGAGDVSLVRGEHGCAAFAGRRLGRVRLVFTRGRRHRRQSRRPHEETRSDRFGCSTTVRSSRPEMLGSTAFSLPSTHRGKSSAYSRPNT